MTSDTTPSVQEGTRSIGEQLNLGDAAQYNAPAILFDNQVIRRGDLDDQSSRYASALLNLGLKPGDRVASLLPNCVEYFVHFLGCLKAGLVAVPFDFRFQIEEIAAGIEAFEPILIVSCASRLADIEACASRDILKKGILEIGAPPNAAFRYEDLLTGSVNPENLRQQELKDPACILVPNASGGRSLGIAHDHGSISLMAKRGCRTLKLNSGDRLLIGTPLCNLSAIQSFLAALSAHAPIILPASGSVQDLAPAVRTLKPTILQISSNALFNLVLDGQLPARSTENMRLFVSGSTHLHRETIETVTSILGLEINETFGFAETGQIATIRHSGSTSPGHGDQFQTRSKPISDELISKTAQNTGGRLEFEPPIHMALTSHQLDEEEKPAQTAPSTFSELQMHTLSPDIDSQQEVETALGAYPGIELVGLGCIPDPFHGHELVAYVVPNDWDFPPPTSEIIQYARNRVGRKAPDTVQYVDILPVTETGRIDPVLLAKMEKNAAYLLSASLNAESTVN
ncbi:MAG: class I adenylate-forming enzyme family protein [Stappiaceae bacterium]